MSSIGTFGYFKYVHYISLGTSALASDGNLRLVDGDSTATNQSGHLEIFLNEEWLSVCGSLFSAGAAQVACWQLGFARADSYCTTGW